MRNLTLRILLVEDDTGDAALLERALVESEYGRFEVVHVRRLAEAIERVTANRFDAILLDLGLPDSNGLETLARILSSASQVPIIVQTDWADPSVGLKAMQQGAQEYLVKSEIERGLVPRTVRYAIERTQAAQRSLEVERRFVSAVDAAPVGSGATIQPGLPSQDARAR